MSSEKITFKDVGGYSLIKKELKTIAESRKLDDHQTPRGLFFYGLPGTGKSLTAKAFANECGLDSKIVCPCDVLSRWYGEGEQNLRNSLNHEGVIVLEEFDLLVKRFDRKRYGEEMSVKLVNIIAEAMDGYEANEKGIFIATSNSLKIYPKLKRAGSFEKIFYFKEPDMPEIADILCVHLKNIQNNAEVQLYNGVDVNTVTKAIYNKSKPESPIVGSDIAEIVTRTHRKKWDQYMKTGVFEKMTTEDFLKTVEEYNKV